MAKSSTTFKGASKPYGATGHFDEPMRHKMQGMGLKTGHLAGGVSAGMATAAPKGRLVSIRIYKFDELPPKIQEKVMQEQRDFLSEVWDADGYIIPNFKEDMEKFGISDVEVNYSGFSSQGDGASFTGFVDLAKFIKATHKEKEYAKLLKEIEAGNVDDGAKIERFNHQYSYAGTTGTNYSVNSDKKDVGMQAELLDNDLNKFIKEKSNDIYKEMQNDYENEMSDESVKDSIEMNEYEFSGDGEIHKGD